MDRGAFLHCVRATGGGGHHDVPRGWDRLSAPGDRLGTGGEVPRLGSVYGTDGSTDVHEARRRVATGVRLEKLEAVYRGGRTVESRGTGVGVSRDLWKWRVGLRGGQLVADGNRRTLSGYVASFSRAAGKG